MLVGVVGATYLTARDARAADMFFKANPFSPNYAAVDGVNSKAGVLGGSLASRSLYAGKGSVTFPLGGSYGAQIDGIAGKWDHRGFGAIGGHLFWRDPSRGLVGLYASHTRWNQFGGVHVTQVAAEGEYYFGRWTVQGIAGVEFGNTAIGPPTMVLVAPGVIGTFAASYDIQTRFFDQINVAYYLTDNWKAFVGHRYLGGKHALALGTEYALPLGRTMAAAFVEGRLGNSDSSGVWGGLKLYFGKKDKSLIQRHRQDDPIDWTADTLFTIRNNFIPAILQGVLINPDGDADGDFCNPDGGECGGGGG